MAITMHVSDYHKYYLSPDNNIIILKGKDQNTRMSLISDYMLKMDV